MKHRLLLLSAVAMLVMTACEKQMEVYPRCFSVSETKQVIFAPGNLMYQPFSKTYRFASEQTEMWGNNNNQISPTYAGWIDLFGWGTGSNPTLTSQVGTDYASFDDWGNHLTESGWRTITYEEWNYLLQKRPNANKLYGTCSVTTDNGWTQPGMVILPDRWDFSLDSIEVEMTNEYNRHVYSTEKWVRMERAGAVFLPACGNRMGTSVNGANEYGRYWTSSPAPMGCAFFFGFVRGNQDDGTLRSNGRAVRLVKDITSPSQVPAAK